MGDIKRVDIHKKLSESEKLMKEMSQTWEEKLVKTGKNPSNLFTIEFLLYFFCL